MDSLVTLKRIISTSTMHCRNKFCTMGWQFYNNILQGVYIPAGKKLSSKRDFRKNTQKDFFASLSQETPIYINRLGLGFFCFVLFCFFFSLKCLYIFANLFLFCFSFSIFSTFLVWIWTNKKKEKKEKKKRAQDSYQNLAYLWDKNW